MNRGHTRISVLVVDPNFKRKLARGVLWVDQREDDFEFVCGPNAGKDGTSTYMGLCRVHYPAHPADGEGGRWATRGVWRFGTDFLLDVPERRENCRPIFSYLRMVDLSEAHSDSYRVTLLICSVARPDTRPRHTNQATSA